MRHLYLVIALLFLSGCASGGDIEGKLKQLRDDINSEIRAQSSELRSAFSDDLKKSEKELRNDLKDTQADLQREIDEIRETHKKYAFETDRSLVDHQKQIFQNKTVTDDTARRVYTLEEIVASRYHMQPQIKEGYVSFVEGDEVAISLGSANGLKKGDRVAVYKGSEKIAVFDIEEVERDSAKGKLPPEADDVSIGDKAVIESKN